VKSGNRRRGGAATQSAITYHRGVTQLPGQPRYPYVAREGWPIVATFVLVSLLLCIPVVWFLKVWATPLIVVCVALCWWCVWFFRDPERTPPEGADAIICPADGVVVGIGPAEPPRELDLSEEVCRGMTRVSIFMNVFDVHVNRAPVTGTISAVNYRRGKFFNASLDKASEHNERFSIALDLPDRRKVVCVQIAGLIARRIVRKVAVGQRLFAGHRYGMIRFGSRVDVYLPAGSSVSVTMGQRVLAGATLLGRIGSVPEAGGAAS